MDVDMDSGSHRSRLSSNGSFVSTSNGADSGGSSSGAAHAQKFRVYNEALLHSAACQMKNCMANDGRCHKIKSSIDHFVRCYGPRRRTSPIESCPNCSRIWGLLCYHAKNCVTPHGQRCVVSQCDYLREKIARKEQEDRAELQRAQAALRAQDWPVEQRIAQVEADRQQVLQIIEHIRAERAAQKADMAL